MAKHKWKRKKKGKACFPIIIVILVEEARKRKKKTWQRRQKYPAMRWKKWGGLKVKDKRIFIHIMVQYLLNFFILFSLPLLKWVPLSLFLKKNWRWFIFPYLSELIFLSHFSLFHYHSTRRSFLEILSSHSANFPFLPSSAVTSFDTFLLLSFSSFRK